MSVHDVLSKFEEVIKNMPVVAIRLDKCTSLAKKLLNTIMENRKTDNTFIIEEQYAIILTLSFLMFSSGEREVGKSEA
ncbi:MAG: hypothetical protein QXK51_11560 [Candidatus Methanomethylicia archaeon]